MFPSPHRCSMVFPAKLVLVINSGVSLCYTTFPAVYLLCNFSLECQNFCSLVLNFLQLPAALIALCCQTEDCFLPTLIDFYSCNTVHGAFCFLKGFEPFLTLRKIWVLALLVKRKLKLDLPFFNNDHLDIMPSCSQRRQ